MTDITKSAIIAMKTYQTNKPQSVHELCAVLLDKLPLQFDGKINALAQMNIIEKGNTIEIWLPTPYEEYLYKVEIDQSRINISKSEHYTDDVNSLAMEDVLTDIVISFIGKQNTEHITPSA